MSDLITLYEPEEMIIMVKPEITLTELDNALAKNGQWIATLLPAERDDQTLGDALARNAYHPRARFGSPLATSVLGGTFETFNGEVFKSGSRVVKSVAGYDTHRAFVGSEVKLFKALELTLKVMPRPMEFIRFYASPSQRSELMKRQPLILEEWQDKLVVELAGQPEDIASDRERLKSQNIITSEIGDEWGEIIRSISREQDAQLRAVPLDPRSLQLLEQLREQLLSKVNA